MSIFVTDSGFKYLSDSSFTKHETVTEYTSAPEEPLAIAGEYVINCIHLNKLTIRAIL
jgi:hypothetical protein